MEGRNDSAANLQTRDDIISRFTLIKCVDTTPTDCPFQTNQSTKNAGGQTLQYACNPGGIGRIEDRRKGGWRNQAEIRLAGANSGALHDPLVKRASYFIA